MLKRLFDVVFSLLGLILSFPVFLVVVFLIKKEDGGPVFYQGVRVGRYGRFFKMLKFRTMVVNADKMGGPSTADDDPRLLKVGKFLRKYKLDELPQLINVLKGEMSFVGPRPEVPFYVNMFTDEEKIILKVKPGITDWASLWNSDEGSILAGSLDSEKDYMEKIRPEKIRLQLKYVKGHNLWVDLMIINQTILKILKR
ncbi:MAG: sugar transferase [Candidatus Omnitrophica bacterium]|nr:sugar transferase [Candidatus Omnitrophota bacterium]MBU4468613.1 sugar transferase [Candidatus Omnitrophota bacterium]MCG2708258.1 sugar transferase [Candidatus Omnitrophota bacterium]